VFDGATTNVKPALAASWTISTDAKTWTFKLRQGVKFHDGTDFNADAVVFNFQRWMDVKHAFHKGGDFSYWSDMFGGFKNDPAESGLVVDTVTASAPDTVVFTLKNPMAPFIQNLAMFPFAIASPTAVKKDIDNYFKNPVGTGPFKFVEWVQGDHITVDANKDYWGEKAKVDRVIWRVITDNTSRYLELKAGTIHAMEGANPDDVTASKSDPNLKMILRPSMNVSYIGYNFADPNLNKKEVRLAIAYAVNRQAIVDALYAGIGTVASQFIPPSVWGNNPELKPYPYDPAKAKTLLQQAGVPDGFSIDFWYMPVSRPYYPDPKAIAEAFAADLAKVGIKANLKTEDWTQYLTDRRGKFPFWMLGWTGDNGDPYNFLYVFFGQLHSATSPNENSWDNKAVRDQLTKAQQTTDQAERTKIYQSVAQTIYDECPRLPVAHTTPPLLFRENVNGYVANPTSTEFYNTVTVS
jgi:peptide/nickel transport system substrate-binding protein